MTDVIVPTGCPLSRRQWQMLSMLARGIRRKNIAARLGVDHSTVSSILHKTYGRLGVTSGEQAVAVAYSAGWMDPVDTEWTDGRLTAAQHLYLAAFDKILGGGAEVPRSQRHKNLRDEEALARANPEVNHHAKSVFMEAAVSLPDRRRSRGDEAMERLLAVVGSGRDPSAPRSGSMETEGSHRGL